LYVAAFLPVLNMGGESQSFYGGQKQTVSGPRFCSQNVTFSYDGSGPMPWPLPVNIPGTIDSCVSEPGMIQGSLLVPAEINHF
jgi:hypothetical protein